MFFLKPIRCKDAWKPFFMGLALWSVAFLMPFSPVFADETPQYSPAQQETLKQLESSEAWKKLSLESRLLQKGIVGRLIVKAVTDIDSWGFESFELGLSEGIIAKVICGLHRSVELNESSTGPNDKYLVKDTFKIGMKLGVSMVVSGDVSYVKKYTIIYPVATKFEGTFHNKFIFNLFLPYQVAKNKLPPKYVLMIEDYLEGRGKLKLGNTLQIPIGFSTALSAIHLNRTFFDNKSDDSMLIFEDRSNSVKWANEVLVGFSILKIPVLKGSIESGVLKRTYLKVSKKVLNENAKASESVTLGMWENNLAPLQKYGTLRLLDDKFLEKMSKYSAFGLAYVEGHRREDHFTEIIPSENNDTIYERYQLYYDQTAKWIWPTTGETKNKTVHLAGEPSKNGQVEKASMLVSFKIKDNKSRMDEIKNGYLHFIDTLAREESFLNFSHIDFKGHWNSTDLKVDVYFNHENIKALSTLTEDEMWNAVSITGKEPKLATAEGRKNLRAHFLKNRKILRVAFNVRAFLRKLVKFQSKPKALEQLRNLTDAIREITYLNKNVYSSEGLAALIEHLGKENVYFYARFRVPTILQKNLTRDAILERVRGPLPKATDVFHPFVFNDAHDTYYFF